ncbi:MAG: zinc ribbon domain-containing protein [Planctomycetota bacterium]|jgi:hypothetical protein
MKRTLWLLAPLLALLPLAAARGQGPVSALENLEIFLWPDYDRPSVLALLTGTLAPDTPLPAVLSVPFPADAQLNAVARIDAQERMIDDIAYSTGTGTLTLTTPDPRFQVEYYLPYRIEDGEHVFSFTWLADLSVDRLNATVQRPRAAPSLLTEPMASQVLEGRDGLTYYRLPAQAVPGGQPFSLTVRYPMASTRLTAERPGGGAGAPTAAPPAAPEPPPTPPFGWPTVLAAIGAGLVTALVAWQLARRRSGPAAQSTAKGDEPAARRYCHACGRPVAPVDRFCSDCGADLEGG